MRKVVVISGAGLSVESGVQAFRGKEGLWCGHDIAKVATGSTWLANADEIRDFYNARRYEIGRAEPNAAHRLLAGMEGSEEFELLHFTQNVDDLLERAGAAEVVHLHGSIRRLRCEMCGHARDVGHQRIRSALCPVCRTKGLVRPDIVLMGEHAPEYARLRSALRSLGEEDALVVIGTSGNVLSVGEIAKQVPGFKILCDPTPSAAIDPRAFHEVVRLPASEGIPRVLELIHASAGSRFPVGRWATVEEEAESGPVGPVKPGRMASLLSWLFRSPRPADC
ncbi:hypothetical protein WV31_10525 [Magnetospirillum sp. ME-1]|uniref:SIR2 family NAD-dependent protein deacylase n=1 Tax=Magnetospirillum sp. ME-1 TaxID=1639348 RepID=UPI000A1799D3|nr:Sir2 family NAD-dependent protein deacetylase [Magnetospirillum sp. ME-1]ARJ66062.1 hypothetical protein WV31_10525 [Magnetospirillum sp. ME-1]